MKQLSLKSLLFLPFFVTALTVQAELSCSDFLTSPSLVQPLKQISEDLTLPYPAQRNSSFRSSNMAATSFTATVDYFKNDITRMQGGKELFKIIQNSNGQFNEILKKDLSEWAKKFLPDYEFIDLDQVKNYPFKSKYPSPRYPILDLSTGVLDSKFLFELYAAKKIPLLKMTDLLSITLMLAQPQLRLQFELAVQLYARALNLGDLNSEDQRQGARTIRPYADMNRLDYIVTIIHFLLDRIVFSLSDKNKHKLVLWGSDNLSFFSSQQMGQTLPQDIKPALDLSLFNHPKAMTYFTTQSELKKPSVLKFFKHLITHKLLSRPAELHMSLPALAHTQLNQQLTHFDLTLVRSNFEAQRKNENFDQAWRRFSGFIHYENEHPASYFVHYPSRFELIKLYLQIAAEDIIQDEDQAEALQPGPLFR
jgi:hypothetical protein